MTAGSGKVIDKDHGYKNLVDRLLTGKGLSVRVLVGVRSTAADSDIAMIAAANEFGTWRIPERSFLRSTIDEQRAKYARLLGDAAKRVLDGVPTLVAYGRVGLVAVGDVQRKIRSRVPPPNAPETIDRKGSDVPLIDTGRLRQSIEYTVEGG